MVEYLVSVSTLLGVSLFNPVWIRSTILDCLRPMKDRKGILRPRAWMVFLVLCMTSNTCECRDSCKSKELFGPSCVFRNLRYLSGDVRIIGKTSRRGSECVDVGQGVQRIEIDVKDTLISWIRLYTINETAAAQVNVTFTLMDGRLAQCPGKKRHVWQNIVDFYCEPRDQRMNTQKVNIEGMIKSTCDIYISGGRYLCNDAVPKMSSEMGQDKSVKNCFDRDYDTMCHTNFERNASIWVTFNNVANVFFYRIVNRRNNMGRIVSAYVNLLDDDFVSVWSRRIDKPLAQYEVGVNVLKSPARVFRISKDAQSSNVFNIMEIEIYGESACLDFFKPTYGVTCDKYCNCANESEQCFFPTGGCPGGCSAGFTGSDCSKRCTTFSYGINCARKCSEQCVDLCDPEDGHCPQCFAGFHGPRCDKSCGLGTFGVNCAFKCSNCLGRRCDKYSGKCDSPLCEPGWMGELCDRKCHEGTWGLQCSNRCSNNCAGDGACFNNGSCVSGCNPGFQQPTCIMGNAPEVPLKVVVWVCFGLSLCVLFEFFYFLAMKPARAKNAE